MKRVLAIVMSISMMAAALVGCGGGEETNLSDIKLKKYVTSLPEYKGLELTASKIEITDEYVDSYIDYMLAQYPILEEVTDRAVENGDVVNIDYVGKDMNGVAFEGGTAQGYNLTIGSGSFIEGFEEGLVGTNIGDTVDLNLTFPEEYHSAEMAGKEVVFTVTVNSISVSKTSELNDEFAQQFGAENVTAFREEVVASLEENATAEYEKELRQQIVDKLTAGAEFSDNLPDGLYNYYKEQIRANYEAYAAAYGVDLTTFLTQYYGMTEEAFEQEVESGAANSTRQAMACALIAEKEGMTVTDDELNEAIETNYANFGYESADAYKEAENTEVYRDYLLTNKVLDFLAENAVITEASAEESAVEEAAE